MKRITMESFGQDLPANWEQIADYLNDIIDRYVEALTTTDEDGVESLDEVELNDRVEDLWEMYWSGDLDGAPAPEEIG